MQNLKRTAALAAGLMIALCASTASAAPKYITAAVADSNRPAADTARDPFRKPVDMMVFAQVRPGEKILELIPGGGYFERIFSVAIGPDGHLLEATPGGAGGAPDVRARSNGISHDPHYGNITEVTLDANGIAGDAPYDL